MKEKDFLKNKKWLIRFCGYCLLLFTIGSCGLNPTGESLMSLKANSSLQQIAKDPYSLLTVKVERNHSFDNNHTYSILDLQWNIIESIPSNASQDPSQYLGILFTNIESPLEDLKGKQFLFILGKNFYGDFFPVPQNVSYNKYELVILNVLFENQELKPHPYYEKLLKEINTFSLNQFIYNIKTINDGCAYNCQYQTGIIPNNIMNGEVNYSLRFLLYDSKSQKAISRSHEKWKIAVGFFQKKTFLLLRDSHLGEVIVDFSAIQKRKKIKYPS